ncbi:MAG: hypothetical protein ABRQ24_05650 [Syntrophomonadaceae bacterium]
MLLGLTYRDNKTGAYIQAHLSSRGHISAQREVTIDGQVYQRMLIKSGPSDVRYQVNSIQAVQASQNLTTTLNILDINGIPFDPNPDDGYIRSYNILVFDWQTISIRQNPSSRGGKPKYIEEEQVKKGSEMAKRALYVLGLDYGMVKVAVTSGKRLYVVRVDSSPILRDKDLAVLLRMLDGVIDIANRPGSREVKMGADPEFMLYNIKNGKMTPASQFFPRDGVVGCDALRTPNRQSRPIAELRPRPANSPLKLLANVEDAMHFAYRLAPYKNIKWLAGSRPFQGYSIGGHIHFSNVELNSHILRALDSYLGLPVFLLENQATAVKRRLKYGFLADFRTKDHGGFEYRTTASWLVSPQIAAAVLCLAKIVASNYLYLTRNCFIDIEAQRAFYEGDQEYLRLVFHDIWSDIKKSDMYHTYKEELQIIEDMVNSRISWDEREDIRKAWAITGTALKKNELLLLQIPEEGDSPHYREPIPAASRRSRSINYDRTIPLGNNYWDRNDRYNNRYASGPVYINTQNYYY